MHGFPLFFLIISAATAANSRAEITLDRNRIGWSSVQFKATKFLVSIKSTVSFSDVTESEIADLLIDPVHGVGVEPNGQVQELYLEANGLGRNSHMSLFLNSDSGAAWGAVPPTSKFGKFLHSLFGGFLFALRRPVEITTRSRRSTPDFSQSWLR